MKYTPEVQKDLWKVITIVLVFAISLTVLKMYDAKTNEVVRVGQKLLDKYVK